MLVVALGVTAAAFVPLLAARGEPARPGRKELGTLSREALAKAILWTTALFGVGSGSPRPGSGQARPILVVADPAHGRHALFGLARFLRRRGHAYVHAVSTPSGPLPQRAEALAHQVQRLRDAAGGPHFDVVAHGVGGLVAAWYLKHVHHGPPVRMVTLGTPWKGTRMAAFSRGQLAHETLPGSPLLDDLSPNPDTLVCIWGTYDPMVLPLDSAVAPGATSVQITGAGHLDLLFSARVFRAVEAALVPQAAGPDEPGGQETEPRYAEELPPAETP